mmetsp:Transcript_9262/g.26073  ORF Transcript_9262/g.26073 Transcript_9262/m.26073 type:complete len:299 (+) Transcript_9262:351-1247(+)
MLLGISQQTSFSLLYPCRCHNVNIVVGIGAGRQLDPLLQHWDNPLSLFNDLVSHLFRIFILQCHVDFYRGPFTEDKVRRTIEHRRAIVDPRIRIQEPFLGKSQHRLLPIGIVPAPPPSHPTLHVRRRAQDAAPRPSHDAKVHGGRRLPTGTDAPPARRFGRVDVDVFDPRNDAAPSHLARPGVERHHDEESAEAQVPEQPAKGRVGRSAREALVGQQLVERNGGQVGGPARQGLGLELVRFGDRCHPPLEALLKRLGGLPLGFRQIRDATGQFGHHVAVIVVVVIVVVLATIVIVVDW